MIGYPETLEEAKKVRYGTWAGNPNGKKYKDDYCSWEVWPQSGSFVPSQCSRKNGYGPDGLYCKQHAKKVKGE